MINSAISLQDVQRQASDTLASFRLTRVRYNLESKRIEMSRETKEELEGLSWDEYFAEYPNQDEQERLKSFVTHYLRMNNSELKGVLAILLLNTPSEMLYILSKGKYPVSDNGLRYVFWELFFALTTIVD
nr:MAG TPA: hypothetical protein [Caudoviricetes sp.]